MRDSSHSESSIQMNNLVPERGNRVGKWMRDMGIMAEKAVVWPHERAVEKSMIEEGEVDRIVGLTPRGGFSKRENVSIASVPSHSYTGGDFDFEYGWALADDAVTALEPQIEPESNLHQFEYNDEERRDQSLDNAFRRITETTDRLLNDEGSTVLYSMDAMNRYELPELAEDVWENQLEYAKRIASHLQEKEFETQVHYNLDDARYVYLSGKR